jgi:hypothetical protein
VAQSDQSAFETQFTGVSSATRCGLLANGLPVVLLPQCRECVNREQANRTRRLHLVVIVFAVDIFEFQLRAR